MHKEDIARSLIKKAHAGHAGLEKWLRIIISRQLRLPLEDQAKLEMSRAQFDGKKFVTGKPVTFHVAPTADFASMPYGPAGQVAKVVEEGGESAISAFFRRPLVLERGGKGRSKDNWQYRLFDIFRAKGKRLSREMFKRWKTDGIIVVHRRKPIAALDLTYALDRKVRDDLQKERNIARRTVELETAQRNEEQLHAEFNRASMRLQNAREHFNEVRQRAVHLVDGGAWKEYIELPDGAALIEDNQQYLEESAQGMRGKFEKAGLGEHAAQALTDIQTMNRRQFRRKYLPLFRAAGQIDHYPHSQVTSILNTRQQNARADEVIATVHEAARMEKVVSRLESEKDRAEARIMRDREKLRRPSIEEAERVRKVKEQAQETFDDLYGDQLGDVDVYVSSPEEDARAAKQELFGDPDITDEQVAALTGIAGWPGRNSVSISYRPGFDSEYSGERQPPVIEIRGSGTYIEYMNRTVSQDRDGKLYMYNAHLKKTDEAPPGIGIKAFYSQILAARSLGVGKVKCNAFRDDAEMTREEWEERRFLEESRVEEYEYELQDAIATQEAAEEEISDAEEKLGALFETLEGLALGDLSIDPDDVDIDELQKFPSSAEMELEEAEDDIRDLLEKMEGEAGVKEADLYTEEPRLWERQPSEFLEETHEKYQTLVNYFAEAKRQGAIVEKVSESDWASMVDEVEEAVEERDDARRDYERAEYQKDQAEMRLEESRDMLEELGENPPQGYVGYKVWPRFGYSARLLDVSPFQYDESLIYDLIDEGLLEEKYSLDEDGEEELDTSLYTMHDLFMTREGRDWWAEEGDSFDATFETMPGAEGKEPRHMQVLNRYIEERVSRAGASSVADFVRRASYVALRDLFMKREAAERTLSENIRRILQAATEVKVEEIDELTPEEEEALDKVWSELAEEWRQEDIEAGIRRPRES